jgi:hypothetical protein
MGCSCRSGGNNNFRQQQQRARANLQAPRRPFVAPPPGIVQPPFSMAPNDSNLSLPRPTLDPSAERRRIQRLQQDAIKRQFGH